MLQDTHAIRLMLVDGDRNFLGDLWQEIEAGQGREAIEIVGVMTCGAEAVALAAIERPEVILIDMDSDTDERIGAIPGLIQACGARVLMLAGSRNLSLSARALKAGAAGYLTKDTAAEQLVSALRRVAGGGVAISEATAASLLESARGGDVPLHSLLSDREFEVFRLLAAGRTPTEIAERLHLSVKTVSTHKARLQQKLNVASTAELVRYALEHGLL